MASRKQMIGDLLVGVQIACMCTFALSQFVTLLVHPKGVSLSWYGFWLAFTLINFFPAIRAHKNKPSRITQQTRFVYGAWTLLNSACLIVMFVRGTAIWDMYDTWTTIGASLGIVLVLLIGRTKRLGITDPIVRGWLAVFFKGVPQLIVAHKVMLYGGDEIAAAAVISGHVAINSRLGQLYFSIREAGWDRNRIGSAISELANEISWLIVTVAWLDF